MIRKGKNIAAWDEIFQTRNLAQIRCSFIYIAMTCVCLAMFDVSLFVVVQYVINSLGNLGSSCTRIYLYGQVLPYLY